MCFRPVYEIDESALMCMNAQCIKKIYTKKIVNKYPYFVLLQFLMHQPLQTPTLIRSALELKNDSIVDQ